MLFNNTSQTEKEYIGNSIRSEKTKQKEINEKTI